MAKKDLEVDMVLNDSKSKESVNKEDESTRQLKTYIFEDGWYKRIYVNTKKRVVLSTKVDVGVQTDQPKLDSKATQTEFADFRDNEESPSEGEEELEVEEEYEWEDEYTGPIYPSQPCLYKRGVSYTPPGWRRVRKKKKVNSKKELFK